MIKIKKPTLEISKYLKIGLISIATVSMFGCANLSKRDIGTGVGAVAGGVLGSTMGKGMGKVAMTGLGAAGGAVVGNAIGGSMDQTDENTRRYNRSVERANHVPHDYYGNDVDYAYSA